MPTHATHCVEVGHSMSVSGTMHTYRCTESEQIRHGMVTDVGRAHFNHACNGGGGRGYQIVMKPS